MKQEKERLATAIWLSKMIRAAGLGNKMLSAMLEYAGGIDDIFSLGQKTVLELVNGPPEKVSRVSAFCKDSSAKENAKEEADRCLPMGIGVLTMQEEDYPPKLKTIASAPAILYYRGENCRNLFQKEYAAAIVGTRSPTAYGIAATKKITAEIVKRDIVIVSGMARGIDSLAHWTALEHHGMTAAVLGCGLDIIYPPENKELMERIVRDGVVVSECPPGTRPLPSCFPARNRIISGLSDCVAVMEASRKSGTMITAGYAGEQGRDLFAVPGSIFSLRSSGTNRLIQDGACVLTDVEDMLWKLPFAKIQSLAICSSGTEAKKPELRELLLYTEKTTDEIAESLGITISEASERLSFMELSGEVIFQNGRFSLTESCK